jgi:hypothetical protein
LEHSAAARSLKTLRSRLTPALNRLRLVAVWQEFAGFKVENSMAADDDDLPTTYLIYAAVVILMLVAAAITTSIIIFH